MPSVKWILGLISALVLPSAFSEECVYDIKDLTSSGLFFANDTILSTAGYGMIINNPNLNQSCSLSLRNLPLSLFQSGVSIYYFFCTDIFSIILDTDDVPQTSYPVLYLQVNKCQLGFEELRKLEIIYDLKVLTYFNLMPTEESLQIQNESKIIENVVAFSIILNTFTEKQPWIFTANSTFPSLVELSLSGIGLQNLPPDMSLRFPNIQSIELVNNKFTYVPNLEFGNDLYPLPSGLTRTPQMQDHYSDSIGIKVKDAFFRKILILDQNFISSLEDFSFNGTLHKISVSKNKLVDISPRVFSNVQGLNSIDLSYNFLSSLPELVFQNCKDLLYLTLSNNNLSEIPADTFKNNRNLTKLDLSHNNLTYFQLGTFSNLKNLKYLDLSYNNIEHFQIEAFPKEFGSLDTVKLSNNNIRNLPIEFLLYNRMTLIDLHNCKITIENFTEILDSINDIPITDIPSYISRTENPKTEINLSNNLITKLDFGNFQESHTNKMLILLKHYKLDLSKNPIECDCHLLPLLDFFQKAKQEKIHTGKEYFYQNWKCQYSPDLKRIPILSLRKEDLYCREPMPNCPKECSCYRRLISKMVIVDCRHRQLTSLPKEMPSGNLEIWLQYNNISKLEQRNYQQRIEILNMNNNRISNLDVLKKLNNLKQANFGSNFLVSLPSSIQELPLGSLNISENYFKCNCDNLWIKSWLLKVKDKVQGWFDIKCLTYNGNIKAITDIPDTEFICFQKGEFLNRYIEIITICLFIIAILICILIFFKLKNRIICSFR